MLGSLPSTRPNRLGRHAREARRRRRREAEGEGRREARRPSQGGAPRPPPRRRPAATADADHRGARPRGPSPCAPPRRPRRAREEVRAKRAPAPPAEKPPSGTELVTTVVQAAGELAQVGLSIGGQMSSAPSSVCRSPSAAIFRAPNRRVRSNPGGRGNQWDVGPGGESAAVAAVAASVASPSAHLAGTPSTNACAFACSLPVLLLALAAPARRGPAAPRPAAPSRLRDRPAPHRHHDAAAASSARARPSPARRRRPAASSPSSASTSSRGQWTRDRPRDGRRRRAPSARAGSPTAPAPPASAPARRRDARAAAATRPSSRSRSTTPQKATWYGPGFYGNKTACGQTLTKTLARRRAQDATRAARRSSFLYRGRTITVPVVDRGPFANGAKWDLTSAAAEQLGFDRAPARVGAPAARLGRLEVADHPRGERLERRAGVASAACGRSSSSASMRSATSGADSRAQRGAGARRLAHRLRVERPERLEDAVALVGRRVGDGRLPGGQAGGEAGRVDDDRPLVADRRVRRRSAPRPARPSRSAPAPKSAKTAARSAISAIRSVAVLDAAVVALALEGAEHQRPRGARHRLVLDRPRQRDQRALAQPPRAALVRDGAEDRRVLALLGRRRRARSSAAATDSPPRRSSTTRRSASTSSLGVQAVAGRGALGHGEAVPLLPHADRPGGEPCLLGHSLIGSPLMDRRAECTGTATTWIAPQTPSCSPALRATSARTCCGRSSSGPRGARADAATRTRRLPGRHRRAARATRSPARASRRRSTACAPPTT